MVRLRYIVLLLVVVVSMQIMEAQNKGRQHIRESYKQYSDSNYVEAQTAAALAMAEDPESYDAKYNYAGSLFKQQKYDEAMQVYNELAAQNKDNKERLSELYHNIGNCYYAKQEFDKSADAYKNALRADANNHTTRYNYVAAKKMLQEQQDQQNQDQQNQDQQNQDQPQNQDQRDQQQQQEQQQEQMEKEDAQRILDALQQDENKLQEERKKMKAAGTRQIEKNW